MIKGGIVGGYYGISEDSQNPVAYYSNKESWRELHARAEQVMIDLQSSKPQLMKSSTVEKEIS